MSNIFSEIGKGFVVTFFSKLVILGIELLIAAILARLLTPEEFGIVAVVVVFTTFFNLLGDIGVGVGIVQNRELTKKHLDGIFIFCVIIALSSAFIFFLSKSFISGFYGDEKYNKIVPLLAISVFFFVINIVPQSILRKKKEFKTIETILIFVNLLSGGLAIILAFKGFSYNSLVFQAIFKSFGLFILNLIYSKYVPELSINFTGVKLIFKYSLYQFLFNVINYFSRNLDNLLIGKYIGVSKLGYYDKAYQLMQFPIRGLANAISPVLHPIFAEYQNDHNVIHKHYVNILELLAIIGVPLSFFLFFNTDTVIFILYGDQWEESVPIFKILSLTIFIQMSLSSTGSIFQALGRTDLLFLSGFLSAITIVSGIIFGVVSKSVETVAYGILIAFSINFISVFIILFKYGFHKGVFSFLKYFVVGGFAGFFQMMFFYFINDLTNIYLNLSFKALISFLCILLSIFVFRRKYLIFFLQLIKKDKV